MPGLTRKDAIDEVKELNRKLKDRRYKDHYEMRKRMEELVKRFNILGKDVM